MAKSAKRLAAFLGTEESDPVNKEPAYEDKLRIVSETISELTVEAGPSGVPVIVEPSHRTTGAGEETAAPLNTNAEISDASPTVSATLGTIPESVAVPQKDDIALEIENASQKSAENLFRQNAPTSQVMKRLSTLVRDDSQEIDDLKALVESGQTVVELDPNLIDESFIRDRMDDGTQSITELARQIENQGQLVPILVRPHPHQEGRYQAAFGHRRLKAVASLGKKIRAVVTQLTDVELIVAQGQENNARLDLSFIEKARFAAAMKAKKFNRETIAAALGISNQSQITWYLQVVERIPAAIIDAIGPAPEIGRKRWLPLAELFQNDTSVLEKAKAFIKTPAFNARETNERFNALVEEVTRKDRLARAEPAYWEAPDMRVKATINSTSKRCTLQIDRNVDSGFAEFVVNNLDALYAKYTGRSDS
ncbi:plasmid partitioning protein RepB [Microvirga sp. BT689]|uniref:plasmid partitioning protein RepB n=1 Tax=Microvirga arvi TaxID=2778731 RepID=UPI001950A82B|nr:plasmid partitioning protein RepB [Microvirga arvi]MBM6584147.1 plasmid partitioning protein RepB [Microvirga arvi]